MKKIIRLLPLALLLPGFFPSAGQAAPDVFEEDFDPPGPAYNDSSILSLDFSNSSNPSGPWSNSDTWANDGVALDAGNLVGWIGGLAYPNSDVDGPSPRPASLNFRIDPRPDDSAAPKNYFQATFQWDQNLANAANDDGKRDVFGWAVRDLGGNVMASLKFVPGDFTSEVSGREGPFDTAVYGYSGAWWSDGTLTGDGYAGAFNRGEWTTFDIALDTLTGLWSASIADVGGTTEGTNRFTFVSNATVASGSDPSYIGALSAIWDPDTSTSSGGRNTLFMDNIVVTATAIPEPSSTALLGCGMALWFGTRRRSKSA